MSVPDDNRPVEDRVTDDAALRYGDEAVRRPARQILVAEGPKKAQKAPAQPTPAPTRTSTVHLHLYLPITVTKYTAQKYYEYIRGPEPGPNDPDHWTNRWDEGGISLVPHFDIKTAVADFKKSLQESGAVVVYMGHTTLDLKKGVALGLTPKGGKQPEIPTKDLTDLLKKAKASLIVLAGCDSKSCIGTFSGGPVVVVTDSGKDLKTNTLEWAPALRAFLDVLIGSEVDDKGKVMLLSGGPGTVNDALDAATREFVKVKSEDRFKLAHGKGSWKMIP
jgi:hypothetical protein